LLVDVRGNLWITDFGLAHFQGRAGLTMTGDLLGTLRYMSPEQALAKRVPIDHRTDIYSMGATLYELLTLQPVFAGSERQELLRQIAFEEPRSPRRHQKAVPRELEIIVLKALEKNPAQRYGTAQEMGDDLERFLKDEPIRARRPNLVQRTRKWTQRHKAATGAMACVAAVCLLVVGAFGYERGQRSQHVEDCLLRARTWMAKNELAKARQELAEARSWIGTYGPLLRKRAAEVENFEADLDNFERFLHLVDEAHDMEFPPPLVVAVQGDLAGQTGSLPQQTKFDRDPGSVVPFLLRALSCYEVLERDDWSTRLEDGILQPEQVARVRRTVYEELMWLANDLVERGADHRSGQKLSPQQRAPRALTYLRQAEAAPPLTAAFYRIRAACHKALADEAQSRKDAELARQTPASIALDHYLLGVAAFDAGKKAEAVEHFEAALRVEPGHYWSLFWLGHSVAALGQSDHDYAAAVAAFSGCLLKRPDHAYAYSSRGNAYAQLHRHAEAVSEFRKALQLRPDDPFAHANMGEALRRQGKLVEAEAEMREALRLRPEMHEVHSNLGTALSEQGKFTEAVAEFHEALRRRPGYSRAITNLVITHYNCGNGLADHGKMAEAEVQYRKALELKPDYADAHCNLGNALQEQGKPREAEAEHRESLRLQPKDPLAHISLGNALAAQGKLPEAMAEYHKALRLRPDEPKAHYNLGTALGAQGKLGEAEAEFRQALRLRPDYASARSNLGITLASQGKLADAEAEFRAAIRLRPDMPEAHGNLGNVLQEQGKLTAAEAEFREAIRLRPGFADAHCNLGQTLRLQGRFADSLDAFRRGHELGSKQPNWRYPSAALVQEAQQLVALDSEVSGVLQGKARPAAAGEQLALAHFCQKHKKLYAAAARFYADAFAADPKLADGLHQPHRYNAACAATLAGCAQGEDAAKLDDGERARLRRQALAWLRADLAAYREFLDKNPEQARPGVQQRLRHWQQDADFAGVRGDSLAKLPERDRQNWHRLWTDVEGTLKKAHQHDAKNKSH
jgi:tetratricopeptide (TPR) repeat protein